VGVSGGVVGEVTHHSAQLWAVTTHPHRRHGAVHLYLPSCPKAAAFGVEHIIEVHVAQV